jgi:hypothetical protein
MDVDVDGELFVMILQIFASAAPYQDSRLGESPSPDSDCDWSDHTISSTFYNVNLGNDLYCSHVPSESSAIISPL